MDPIKQILEDASKYIREDTGKIKKQYFFDANHLTKTDIVFKVVIHFLKEKKLADVDQSALRNLNSALDERIKVLEKPPLVSRIILSLFQWTTNSKVQRQIGEVRSLSEWVKPEQKLTPPPLSFKATTVSKMAIPDLGIIHEGMALSMDRGIPVPPPLAPPMAPEGPSMNMKISKPFLFDADFLFKDEPTPPRGFDINKADKSLLETRKKELSDYKTALEKALILPKLEMKHYQDITEELQAIRQKLTTFKTIVTKADEYLKTLERETQKHPGQPVKISLGKDEVNFYPAKKEEIRDDNGTHFISVYINEQGIKYTVNERVDIEVFKAQLQSDRSNAQQRIQDLEKQITILGEEINHTLREIPKIPHPSKNNPPRDEAVKMLDEQINKKTKWIEEVVRLENLCEKKLKEMDAPVVQLLQTAPILPQRVIKKGLPEEAPNPMNIQISMRGKNRADFNNQFYGITDSVREELEAPEIES